MVDLDTIAMYLGYSTMISTGAVLMAGYAYQRHPEECTQAFVSSVAKCGEAYDKCVACYDSYVKPTYSLYSRAISRIITVPTQSNRVFLVKNGKTVESFPLIEDAQNAEVDENAYDMILYNFDDGYPKVMIRYDFTKELSDEFHLSEYRFLNVTLKIGEESYTMNLEKPSMLYVEGNILLDKSFVAWWCRERLGFTDTPDKYQITLIDADAQHHVLTPDDAVQIGTGGYEILEKNDKKDATNEDDTETGTETDIKENNNPTPAKSETTRRGWFSWGS